MDPSDALRPSLDQARDAWAGLVDADAEQVGRLREAERAGDHYGLIAGHFRSSRASAAELDTLTSLVRPGDTWLDIGAGGGRFALPLARLVRRIIAVEPSPAMRGVLTDEMAAARVTNITVRDARWPVDGWMEEGDVALAAHSLYDIREPIPFLEAMEQSARRLCVVALRRLPRGSEFADLFAAVHGEPFQALPGLREFVALLGALGRPYEVRRLMSDPAPTAVAPDEAHALAQRMLWLRPGSDKDRRMCGLMDEWRGDSGGIRVPVGFGEIGIVTWETRR